MEVRELRNEMLELFEQVRLRFEQIDQRFEHIDQRFEQVDRRFEQVDRRFEQVDRRFVELTDLVIAQNEETRRYFTIMLEQMKAERNIALDQSAANTERLDDHERRIRSLERRK